MENSPNDTATTRLLPYENWALRCCANPRIFQAAATIIKVQVTEFYQSQGSKDALLEVL